MNEKFCISIQISLKFVPKGKMDNKSALVQIMAWHRPGDKPLSEPVMLDYRCIYVLLSLNVKEDPWCVEIKLQQYFPVINGLVQERCNSSVLAMELRLSWTNPLIYAYQV